MYFKSVNYLLFSIYLIALWQGDALAQENQSVASVTMLNELKTSDIEIINTAKEMILISEEQKKEARKIHAEALSVYKLADAAQDDEFKKMNFDKSKRLKNKALSTEIEALDNHNKANTIVYEMYAKHFEKIHPFLLGNDIERKMGNRYEMNADSLFRRTDTIKINIKEILELEQIYQNWVYIIELQKIALNYQEKAYNIYKYWTIRDASLLNPPSINDKTVLFGHFEIKYIASKYDVLAALDTISGLNELLRNLEDDKLKLIKDADKNILTANELLKRAKELDKQIAELKHYAIAAQDQKIRRKSKKKANKLTIKNVEIKEEANNIVEDANFDKYNTYKQSFEQARKEFVGSDADFIKAQMMEELADNYFSEAQVIRQNMNKTEKPEEISLLILEANSLETIAIEKQEEAINIYLKAKALNHYFEEEQINFALANDSNNFETAAGDSIDFENYTEPELNDSSILVAQNANNENISEPDTLLINNNNNSNIENIISEQPDNQLESLTENLNNETNKTNSEEDLVTELSENEKFTEEGDSIEIAETDSLSKKEFEQNTINEDEAIQQEFDAKNKAIEIHYIIQLALVNQELTETELNNLYTGTQVVEIDNRNGVIRYYIGGFKRLNEATAHIEIYNIKNAVTIAVREGREFVVNKSTE